MNEITLSIGLIIFQLICIVYLLYLLQNEKYNTRKGIFDSIKKNGRFRWYDKMITGKVMRKKLEEVDVSQWEDVKD